MRHPHPCSEEPQSRRPLGKAVTAQASSKPHTRRERAGTEGLQLGEDPKTPTHSQSPPSVQGTQAGHPCSALHGRFSQATHLPGVTRPLPWPGSVNKASVCSLHSATSGSQAGGIAENGFATYWAAHRAESPRPPGFLRQPVGKQCLLT